MFDDELYPRKSVWWLTIYKYSEEMKSGSDFPPIDVGDYNGKNIVVDGWHRCRALIKNGEEYVKANIKRYDDLKSIFIDAVKLNSEHGRQLSSTDKVKIIAKLEDFQLSQVEISELVKVSMDKIERFNSRIIRGPRGVIHLKSIVARQVEKGIITQEEAAKLDQHVFKAYNIPELLVQLIELIENKAFPWNIESVRELATQLHGLIGGALS